MSRVTVAERTKLSVFLVRGALRKLVSRVTGHPLAHWPFPSKTDRLLIAPQDLRTADPTRASELFAGRFAFAGKVVSTDNRSPFEVIPPSPEWAEALADSTDWGPTAAAFRDLLAQWKQAGRASKDVDDALWQRFKGAQEQRIPLKTV